MAQISRERTVSSYVTPPRLGQALALLRVTAERGHTIRESVCITDIRLSAYKSLSLSPNAVVTPGG